jgi:hypothetical protein
MDRVSEGNVLREDRGQETEVRGRLFLPDQEIEFEAGEVGAVLEAALTGADRAIRHRVRMKSRSFTKQFIFILWCEACFQWNDWTTPIPGDYGITLTDIGGASRAGVLARAGNLYLNGGAGDINRGLVVGTGTNAPTIDDFRLQSQIGHGTGSGQLQYSAVTFGAPSTDGLLSQFTVTRDFANNSGAPVTVYEAGLYCRAYPNADAYFCIVRDVISARIVVNNGETLTLNYRIQAML